MIIKRNLIAVPFDSNRISKAIQNAMINTEIGLDLELANDIPKKISDLVQNEKRDYTVEEIQELVENYLMNSNRKDVAKQYILYRHNKETRRSYATKNRLLSDEFISKYKHINNPMNDIGKFTYYRTYSRFLENENRREYWWETCRRAVEYNCSLVKNTSKEEAEQLFDGMFNLKTFLSGRTLWIGGTKASINYPLSNYNCSAVVVDSFHKFSDLFYMLMIGAGVGFRILKEDVLKLPKIKSKENRVKLVHKQFSPIRKDLRKDNTSLNFWDNESLEVIVGDSKEGWVSSLTCFIEVMYKNEYKNIKTVILNYDNVRPFGEKLKTFGGKASGHESLLNMFDKIYYIFYNRGDNECKLKPIDCLDICNIIGENVVVGGTRRTSEIGIFDPDDSEVFNAKTFLYQQNDSGDWELNSKISHRKNSNNTIARNQKPSKQELHEQVLAMRLSGEPSFYNFEAANKRRPNFKSTNPCGEVLLDDCQTCNLTTNNAMAFVTSDGDFRKEDFLNCYKLSVRAGYRMTNVELELPFWNIQQKKDRLLGVSLTGWQDMKNATNMSNEEEIFLLSEIKECAKNTAYDYADSLGSNRPLLVTTVKPEGSLSIVAGGVSPGIHYSHSDYYIRRIRINSNDPLLNVMKDLNYNIGYDDDKIAFIEFPIKSPKGKTKYDVTAIEQLQNYIRFQKNYTEHNTSITVHVRDHEWNDVENFIYDNWDDIVGVSFLSLTDHFYPNAPYETISEAKYNEIKSKILPFSEFLLKKYENQNIETELQSDCENGVCPVR